MDRLALFSAWLFSILRVLTPVFDWDMYWHLANGREMVNTGRLVSEEVFSYTHFGEKFDNHEWLGQIIFYLIWHNLGPYGLLCFKLLATSIVVLLLYRTIRAVGGQPWLAAVLCVFAVLAGSPRYVERPELFSLLNTALLSFILYGFRTNQLPRRLLWLVPLILVVWDWLHGSVYGLVLFSLFVAGENAKHFLPVLRHQQSLSQDNLKYLNRCFAVAISAMLLNPLGLLSYRHFFVLASGISGANKINELQPIWVVWSDCIPYILLLVWAALLSLRNIRRLDITQLMVLLVFGYAGLRYNRVMGVFAIILVPIIASLITVNMQNARFRMEAKLHTLMVIMAAVFTIGYRLDNEFHDVRNVFLNIMVEEENLPVGSVRFVKAMGLTGNLYNSGQFGGYLAYYLTPERKIFQYNMPPIFGDTFHRPEELRRWDINYAIVGVGHEMAMFTTDEWAKIYADPYALLAIRRTPQNQALISQYEIRYFHPLMGKEKLVDMFANPEILPTLIFEMGVYLAYIRDDGIADLWAETLANSPSLRSSPRIQQLLQLALRYNNTGKMAQL